VRGRNSKGARFRSLSGVVSAHTQQMRCFSKSRMNCGRCHPAWRNSIAKRKSLGSWPMKLRSASLPSFGAKEGGSWMRITPSFVPSGSMARRNELSSAAQLRSREVCVIWRGSLQVKRKPPGVIWTQRRTLFSGGTAWKVESTSTAVKWLA